MRADRARGVAALCGLSAVITLSCGAGVSRDPLAPMLGDGGDDSPDKQPEVSGDGRCSPTARFNLPLPVPGLNDHYRQRIARMSPDELTVYFTRDFNDDNKLQVVKARRDSREVPFTEVQLLDGVQSPTDEFDVSMTADGLHLYLERAEESTISIYQANRAATDAPFSTPMLMQALNLSGLDGGPYVLPQGGTVYFHSNQNLNDADIFVASHLEGGIQITRVTNIDSPVEESFPVVTADELTIYFASGRGDGRNGVDIWMATRASRTEDFGAPINLQDVNSGADDRPTWISPDGCRLYLERGVGLTSEIESFFVAERIR